MTRAELLKWAEERDWDVQAIFDLDSPRGHCLWSFRCFKIVKGDPSFCVTISQLGHRIECPNYRLYEHIKSCIEKLEGEDFEDEL